MSIHIYIYAKYCIVCSVNLSHCPLKTTFFIAIEHAASGKNEYSCEVACFKSVVRGRQEQHLSCKDYGHEECFKFPQYAITGRHFAASSTLWQ